MARLLRIEYPGAIYHVTSRMVGDWRTERPLLFRDNADRQRFVDRLGERVEKYNIRLFLFVCMTNHFHLVFETPAGNCSKFMQALTTAYTVYYNLRHGRHGHLLEGRYKARLVSGDEYLLKLSRYVHLNPVQTEGVKCKPLEERVKVLRAYPWSSYLDYIGKRKALGFVSYGPLLAEMAGEERGRPKRYREFVEAGLTESDEDFNAALRRSPRSIGDDHFRAWVDDLHRKRVERVAKPEDVSFRHVTEPLSGQAVLAIMSDVFGVKQELIRRRSNDCTLRAVAAQFLIRYTGLSQREAAIFLEIGSGSAVCKQLAVLSGKLEKDARLRRLVRQAEERLQKRQTENACVQNSIFKG